MTTRPLGTPRRLGPSERQLALACGPGWCVQLLEIRYAVPEDGGHWEVCVQDETGDDGEFALDGPSDAVEWFQAEVDKRCKRWLDTGELS